MESPTIILTPRFSASPERVFRAFTTPADLQQWAWGSIGVDLIADVDVRVGEAMNISTLRSDGSRWAMIGTYTDVVPNQRLVHTLRWDAPMGYESVNERIAIDFVAKDGGTEVVFSHSGVPAGDAQKEHIGGWNNCFEALEKVLRA